MAGLLFTVTRREKENDLIIVYGKTCIGKLKGIWKGRDMPEVMSYHIELSFGDIERKEVTINDTVENADMKIECDKVIFTAECEDIDDDVYYMRFSYDGLEMLCIENDDHTIKKGDIVSFSILFREIGIYPYTI